MELNEVGMYVFIWILIALVFLLAWSGVCMMDKIRVREEALQWLSDNGHLTTAAERKVSEMIAESE